MRSNIHALKNRLDATPKLREAYDGWPELLDLSRRVGLSPSVPALTRTFLGHLLVDKKGGLADLAWLSATGIVSNDQIIDWGKSVAS